MLIKKSAVSRTCLLLVLSCFLQISFADDATIKRNPLWAQPVETSVNMYQVDNNFYRSAQLDKKELPKLNALGIKTIVNLRAFHSDDDLIHNSGIVAVRVPINTWDINDAKVVSALKALRAAQQTGPVLLHCQHGADRTGLITAMYRLVYQGWTKEAATEELIQGGYGYHAMWKNIPRYIKQVDIEKIRTALEAEDKTKLPIKSAATPN